MSSNPGDRYLASAQVAPWEGLDLEKGVNCWFALFHFVDAAKARTLYDLEVMGYSDNSLLSAAASEDEQVEFRVNAARRQNLENELTDELFRMLRSCKLVAKGLSSTGPLDAIRREIHPDRWEDLDLNVRESKASGQGLDVSSILIFNLPNLIDIASRKDARVPEALVRKWYQKRADEWPKDQKHPSCKQDVAAAKMEFLGKKGVTKRLIESIRGELAPEEWVLPGRRKEK